MESQHWRAKCFLALVVVEDGAASALEARKSVQSGKPIQAMAPLMALGMKAFQDSIPTRIALCMR